MPAQFAEAGVGTGADRHSGYLLSDSRTWRLCAWAWAVISVASYVMRFLVSHLSPDGPVSLARNLDRLVYGVPGFMATILAIGISERFLVRRPSDIGRLSALFGCGILIALAWSAVAYTLNVIIVPGYLPMGYERMAIAGGTQATFVIWCCMGLVHAYVYSSRAQQRELAAARRAELHATARFQVLKMELQPHFLFNALNTVSGMMYTDIRKANEVLVTLSDMLRESLQRISEPEVQLDEEVAALRRFVAIEEIRFGGALKVDWEIPNETERCMVPHLLLQPLFENAVKHGVSRLDGGGHIRIAASRRGAQLELQVVDNGPGLRQSSGGSTGIGLRNTRLRLEQLYGQAAIFEVAERVSGGVGAVVRIPVRLSGSAADPGLPNHAAAS